MVAKKSAARVKPINKKIIEKPEFEPLEDIFETMKKSFVMTTETNVVTAKRVDNLASLRDSAYAFWGSAYLDDNLLPGDRYRYLMRLRDVSIAAYEKIHEIAKTFELEEFIKGDMKDYFEDVVPSVEDIKDEKGLLEALIIFKCVQPYGSKMLQMHQMLMDEIEKRKVYEKED